MGIYISEKKKCHDFFAIHAISNISKKINWCIKKIWGGGGEVLKYFIFFRRIILILRFMLLSTLKKILLKSAPSLNG